MLKNKTKLITVSLAVIAITIAVIQYFSQPKVAWFDYNTIYNNCKLKKTLEKDLQRLTATRKSTLDSMQLELSFVSERVQAGSASPDELDSFEDKKARFLTYQDQYEQENMRLKESYFGQIRKEINDKSRMYAESNGYDYLFAALGDGSLMYASEGEEVTKDFQAYVDKE